MRRLHRILATFARPSPTQRALFAHEANLAALAALLRSDRAWLARRLAFELGGA